MNETSYQLTLIQHQAQTAAGMSYHQPHLYFALLLFLQVGYMPSSSSALCCFFPSLHKIQKPNTNLCHITKSPITTLPSKEKKKYNIICTKVGWNLSHPSSPPSIISCSCFTSAFTISSASTIFAFITVDGIFDLVARLVFFTVFCYPTCTFTITLHFTALSWRLWYFTSTSG